jgi:CubicO group peptidase (beta-lactamase class C family)
VTGRLPTPVRFWFGIVIALAGLPAVALPPSLASESDASFGEPRQSPSGGGGAKAGGALVERLDSIAGAGVREDRSVGLVAAVVKDTDPLLVNFYRAYGKADVEGDVPATVDTMFPIGSDTKQRSSAVIRSRSLRGACKPTATPASGFSVSSSRRRAG